MVVGTHRNAQILISKSALYHNISNEKKRLKNNEYLFMVVKANGYGHGAVAVAHEAKKAGADGFCVAILDEALQLRDAGFDEPILVLGITDVEHASLMAERNISATVSSIDWLRAADEQLAQKDLPKLNVHIGLDTGMGRIGFQDKDSLKEAVAFLNQSDNLNFEGIFTHFSTADTHNVKYFDLQVERFNDLISVIDTLPKYIHVSNSATSLWHSEFNCNMIRFGVAGYGLNPSGGELDLPYELKPALSLTTEVVYCKKIDAGRSVGYGATYTSKEPEWIATVPVGYADGIVRALQGFSLLVNGKFCPIVGRVCMDQLMIKLDEPVKPGTKVTIVGQDGKEKITLQDIASYCDTIHYEVACLLTDRLPRIVVE
ncbi:alanine racemase [Apilactobacillus kunkeei]|uniref:alanine racemase n=1 Tax=Apilactobacillus kunkeei TaxID=148814 RepID=UPI0006B25953|nr:alanine racemase [Apilactobacillus kunkeei]KOY71789.1 Alanine racemase [Apilactobacillus kunkeei]KOY78400.1 Alanine racemase [Apilactobacillus kunkeei]